MEDGKLYCCYCKERSGYIRDIDGFRIAGTKQYWGDVISSESDVYIFDEVKLREHVLKWTSNVCIPNMDMPKGE